MNGLGIWLAAFGGMLLGMTVIVLTLYWERTSGRRHVLSISASYMILVALAMQPALGVHIDTRAHIGLALIAYALGAWSIWELVPVRRREDDSQ